MLPDLDDLLSQPTPQVVEALRSLDGDIAVIGAGGKMGPTLARMARRALDAAGSRHRVLAASRFPDDEPRRRLEAWGIEAVRCDLLCREQALALPEASNVLFLAGRKFGSTGREGLTWATNTIAPAHACERYRESRIVAFSTGNVYPLVPVSTGGATEADPPAPVGDYGMSCLGRERIFQHFSEILGTHVTLFRLNYACDLRYGIVVDLALKILAGETIDLEMGWFNVIWQGDANAWALRSLSCASSPPSILNATGPETLRVRDVCEELGRLLGRPPSFRGEERPDALLSDAGKARRLFGPPRVTAPELLRRVAEWILGGGEILDRPTHFEVRDGRF